MVFIRSATFDPVTFDPVTLDPVTLHPVTLHPNHISPKPHLTQTTFDPNHAHTPKKCFPLSQLLNTTFQPNHISPKIFSLITSIIKHISTKTR